MVTGRPERRLPHDALENELIKIEGPAIEAIRRIERDRAPPSPEEHEAIVSLIALQSLRGPDHRDRVTEMHKAALCAISNGINWDTESTSPPR